MKTPSNDRRRYAAALCLLTLLLAAGCVSETAKPKAALGTRPRESYRPITRHRARLELVGSRQLVAGLPASVTFSLTNGGTEALKVPEWYSYEPDNVLVYCQPWLPGTTAPDESAWIELSFDPRRPPVRYPLELLPGNRVSVTKELPFIEKLVVSPGAERRYFIKGELTLKSLKLSTPVAAIAVRAPTAEELRRKPKDPKEREMEELRNAAPARKVPPRAPNSTRFGR